MSIHRFARGAIAAENARRYIMLRGYTPNGFRVWDSTEQGNLHRQYPDYAAAVALNPTRTRPAHYSKAGRMGITSPRTRPWDHYNELPKLHRMFPRAAKADLLAAFPDRTWHAICARAGKDGYRRPKRPFRPTGCALLDQILERAQKKNWSLVDIDAHVRGRGYFKNRRWRHGSFDDTVHGMAVAALGGRLRARWPD